MSLELGPHTEHEIAVGLSGSAARDPSCQLLFLFSFICGLSRRRLGPDAVSTIDETHSGGRQAEPETRWSESVAPALLLL